MAEANVTKYIPDAERIELAAQVIDRAYDIARALEQMKEEAFDGETLYETASQQLGARVRALSPTPAIGF